MKRATEIGNTFYLKAKENMEAEDLKIKTGYLNAQQFETFRVKNQNNKADDVFKSEAIQVKMMSELLKQELQDVKTDLNLLFKQNYNFAERQERKPNWMAGS